MEAENKDLKARIERQEAFHKRRMEKEKKDKRVRSGPAGSSRAPPIGGGIASGEFRSEENETKGETERQRDKNQQEAVAARVGAGEAA